MKEQRDIVVMPVETTARELLPKLYLAIKLAEQGFVSYLGMKSMVTEVAVRSGKAIYLDKGYHSGVSESVFAKLRHADCLIIDLDEENGVDFKDFHMLNTRMPDQLFSLVDQILVWGEAQYAHLRENRASFDSSRITVTGHPRFDLVKPEFRGLYTEKVDRLRRQYGAFVLFNTNTKFGNNINGRAFIIENYLSRVKGLMERLEYDDRRLEANVHLVRRLAEETAFSVVVRPHPEENIETYREIFAGVPGVHVVYEGAPIDWLLASEHVIHNHSTTGLEAAMLGKVPISYSPIEVDLEFVPWLPIACSLNLTSADEVVDLIGKDRAAWPELPNVGAFLQSFFSYDQPAAPLVVEAVKRLAEANPAGSAGKGLAAYLVKLKAKGVLQRFKGDAAISALARNKLNDLKPPVVKQRFAELLAQGVAARPVRLETLHPLLYRVSPQGTGSSGRHDA